MSTITAILPDQAAAEQVTEQLNALQDDSLDWRLVESEDDQQRILPAAGWSLGGATPASSGQGLAAIPIKYDYPEEEALHDRGVPRDEAESYGRTVERGGIAIIIETPSAHENTVRRILAEANAQQIADQ